MAQSRRRWIPALAFAALTLPVGFWTVQAHGTGNPYGRNVQFGELGAEDADTIRKVTPRQITINVNETVTFHVNGGHQVVVLKPGVPLETLGSEGVNLDGTGPQTPLPPQVFGNNVIATGLRPNLGPGRWDMNPRTIPGPIPGTVINCDLATATQPPGGIVTETTNIDRPEVFDKQDCPTPQGAIQDFTTIPFTAPGRYAFFGNFPAHHWDEGISVTGPANRDAPVTVNGFGMHGFIYVQ